MNPVFSVVPANSSLTVDIKAGNDTTVAAVSAKQPATDKYPFVDVKQFLHCALPTYNHRAILDRYVYDVIEETEEQTKLAVEFFDEYYNQIQNDKDKREPIDILCLLQADPKWSPLLALHEKIKAKVAEERFKNGFVGKESFDAGAKDTFYVTDEAEEFETNVWKKYKKLLGGEDSVLSKQLETAWQHSAQLASLKEVLTVLTEHFKLVKEYISIDDSMGRGIKKFEYYQKRVTGMVSNFLCDFLECLHAYDKKPFKTNRMAYLRLQYEAEDMIRFITIVDVAEKSKNVPLNQKLALAQKTLMELVQQLDTIVFSITDVDTLSEALDPLIKFLPEKASDLQLVPTTATGAAAIAAPPKKSAPVHVEKVSVLSLDFEDEELVPTDSGTLVAASTELANLPPPEAIPNLIMEHLESIGLTKEKFVECKKSCQFLRENPLMVAVLGAGEREIAEFHRKQHILLKDSVKVLEQALTSYRVYSCRKSYLPAKIPCGIGIAEYDTRLGMQWRAYTDQDGDVIGFSSQTRDAARMISRPLPPSHPLPRRVFDMAMTFLNETPGSNALTRLDYAIPARVIKKLFGRRQEFNLVIDYLGFNPAVAIELGITVDKFSQELLRGITWNVTPQKPYVRIVELNPAYCGELASSFNISWDELKKLNAENQQRKAGEAKKVIVKVDNNAAGAVYGEMAGDKFALKELDAFLKLGL